MSDGDQQHRGCVCPLDVKKWQKVGREPGRVLLWQQFEFSHNLRLKHPRECLASSEQRVTAMIMMMMMMLTTVVMMMQILRAE